MSTHVQVRSTLRPLADKVVVRVESERTTAAGIVIPDTAAVNSARAHVLAVGPGARTQQGDIVEPAVQEGDTVVFSPYAGTRIDIEGEELVVLSEADILAVVEGGK